MSNEQATERLLARGLPLVLAKFARNIEDHVLSQIVVHPSRANGLAPWVSKLCGVPYWPKGTEYPRDIDGKPMAMLVQLNFAELPTLPHYPRTGLLQFFISVSPDEGPCSHDYGMRTDGNWEHGTDSEVEAYCDQRYFRMVYHEHVTDDLGALNLEMPELPYGLLPMQREAAVSFSLRDSYVNTSDYRFARVFGMDIDQLQKTALNDDFGAVMEYSKFSEKRVPIVVGGYSVTEQGYDPRIIQPNEDWLVLLSIDTTPDNDVYMAWGDGGVANWWIRREDLAQRNFSNVMYYCDSG